MSSGVWIERDAGGHSYYVRKKEKQSQLSEKQQPTESFLTLRRRPNPLLRVFRRDNIVVPANIDRPPTAEPPRPSSSPAQKSPDANATSKKKKRDMNPRSTPIGNTSQPPTVYLSPRFGMLPPFNPPPIPPTGSDNSRNGQDAQENQGAMVKSLERQPQQQFNAPPFPSMWGAMPGPHPMMPLPNPTMNFHAPPSLSYQGPGPAAVPPPSQIFISHRHSPIAPQTIPAEVLKYKCQVCGKTRSAGYHHDHPLLPGQPPGKTTCRDCREYIPDSDDDSISRHEARKIYPKGSRARNDSKMSSQKTDRSRTYTSRGPSIARHSERHSYGTNLTEGRFDEHAYRRRSPSPAARMMHHAYTPPRRESSEETRTWGNNHRTDRPREHNQWHEEGYPEESYDRRLVHGKRDR